MKPYEKTSKTSASEGHNMAADIKKYCDDCIVCRRASDHARKRIGHLIPLPTPIKCFQRINVDFIPNLPVEEYMVPITPAKMLSVYSINRFLSSTVFQLKLFPTMIPKSPTSSYICSLGSCDYGKFKYSIETNQFETFFEEDTFDRTCHSSIGTLMINLNLNQRHHFLENSLSRLNIYLKLVNSMSSEEFDCSMIELSFNSTFDAINLLSIASSSIGTFESNLIGVDNDSNDKSNNRGMISNTYLKREETSRNYHLLLLINMLSYHILSYPIQSKSYFQLANQIYT
ncbi:hypothetical protein PPL_04885 [Heterostelium album PN500]|uniref:Uncharacterized protein n=1 Tax=Heterostelium pallidum (strain ATCC 26659 / Pp 5 / PN500) TaxID=670386 RepID=D3B8U2_HETP5|nr:hypothetical protein PPL_04885 [Heterostelium album PN500]EFA82460.1 hypothetical protein PPL_04885 [Heterostelium album PN500]|eukprot:XP_020434577.1 hypothetical protein PPL_04885 [Heterostelium album PN500]